MKKGDEYEVVVESTEFPMCGIAHIDGYKTYIKNALPDEKLSVRITKKRKNHVDAKIIEVIEKSPNKIEAICPHFGICGGCSNLDVTYDFQLSLKEKQVLKLLEDDSIEGFEYLGIEKSPDIFGYRNKMEFTFGDFEKGGELTLGMHVKNRGFAIESVENCKIVDSDYNLILKTVMDYFRTQKFPHYRVMSHTGYLRNLVVRKAANTKEILINIVTTSEIDFDFTEINDILMNLNYEGKLVGIIHCINDSLSDTVAADRVDLLYGRDYIIEELLGLKFKISSFSFFQTNSRGAEKLYTIIKDFLGDAFDKTVFDLYCGTGTIGQIIAKNAKKVIGIELIEEAVKSANENAKFNGLDNCEFIAGDVGKIIKDVTASPDIIILDPPRPGVQPVALDYVLKFNAKEIIYVSCNPVSLVRDLKVILGSGYKIEKVKLMDMFPHTGHVETVILMTRCGQNDK